MYVYNLCICATLVQFSVQMCPRGRLRPPTFMAGASSAQQVPIAGLAPSDAMVHKAKDKEPFNTARQRVRQPTEVQLSHYSADGWTLRTYISQETLWLNAAIAMASRESACLQKRRQRANASAEQHKKTKAADRRRKRHFLLEETRVHRLAWTYALHNSYAACACVCVQPCMEFLRSLCCRSPCYVCHFITSIIQLRLETTLV